ncbi:MAG: hypothetical protein LBT80_05580 [Lactobacillaceae bacterium]|jgi:hypothetical protein|nr:hypothetical protein [Lactobacillaceae bacterium]
MDKMLVEQNIYQLEANIAYMQGEIADLLARINDAENELLYWQGMRY